MIDSERSERVVDLGECGQAEGLSKPCASTAAFPQTVSGWRNVDNSGSVVGRRVLLRLESVGVSRVGDGAPVDAGWQSLPT
jgi:hypothetical protein